MKKLELKIPPVIVFLVCLGLIWFINQWTFVEGLKFGTGNGIVILIVLVGALIGLLGVIEFRRKSTTVNPHKPKNATSLVTTGIYTFSRNPMYTALLIILIAGDRKSVV